MRSISTATAGATWSNSVPDLVASTANNLKKDGWVRGQTWGYEVTVPQGFNYLHADRSRMMTMREWERAGIRRAGGKAFPRADDRAYLLVPAGAQGPGFLMLQNFRVIMKYNPAEAYALAIGHLGRPAARRRAFRAAVAAPRAGADAGERYELQQLLARHGYDVGEPDGRLGGQDPRRASPVPGRRRRCSGRLRLGGDSGAVARQIARDFAVVLGVIGTAGHLQVDIFVVLLADSGGRLLWRGPAVA